MAQSTLFWTACHINFFFFQNLIFFFLLSIYIALSSHRMVCCIVGAIDAHGQKTITTIYKKEEVSVLHITHALLLPASFVALKKKKNSQRLG